MSLLKILQYGHPRLREKAMDVRGIGAREKDLIAAMIETMYEARGIGLAATQVGVMERLFVFDVDQREAEEEKGAEKYRNPQVLINPEIVWESDEDEPFEEGCLSIPEVKGEIYRPAAIKVVGRDEHFEPVEIEADELTARVIQHETDHLNGILFTDYLPRTKKLLISPKLGKLKREALAELDQLPDDYPISI